MQEHFPKKNSGEGVGIAESRKVPHRLVVFTGPSGAFGEEGAANLLKDTTETVEWLGEKKDGQILYPSGDVISGINSMHKRSEGYIICEGIVAIGKKRGEEVNVSFLTHEQPEAYIYNDDFVQDITSRVGDFASMTEEGTREYAVFTSSNDERSQRSAQKLVSLLKGIAGVQPSIVGVPNSGDELSTVFLDTINRRLYITYK